MAMVRNLIKKLRSKGARRAVGSSNGLCVSEHCDTGTSHGLSEGVHQPYDATECDSEPEYEVQWSGLGTGSQEGGLGSGGTTQGTGGTGGAQGSGDTGGGYMTAGTGDGQPPDGSSQGVVGFCGTEGAQGTRGSGGGVYGGGHGTGDGDQGTGDGAQGTGDGDQGTGDGDQGTGDGDQGTGDGDQGTGDGAQGTGDGDQGTGDGDQGTGVGDQGTGDGAQGTGGNEDSDGWGKGDDDRSWFSEDDIQFTSQPSLPPPPIVFEPPAPSVPNNPLWRGKNADKNRNRKGSRNKRKRMSEQIQKQEFRRYGSLDKKYRKVYQVVNVYNTREQEWDADDLVKECEYRMYHGGVKLVVMDRMIAEQTVGLSKEFKVFLSKRLGEQYDKLQEYNARTSKTDCRYCRRGHSLSSCAAFTKKLNMVRETAYELWNSYSPTTRNDVIQQIRRED